MPFYNPRKVSAAQEHAGALPVPQGTQSVQLQGSSSRHGIKGGGAWPLMILTWQLCCRIWPATDAMHVMSQARELSLQRLRRSWLGDLSACRGSSSACRRPALRHAYTDCSAFAPNPETNCHLHACPHGHRGTGLNFSPCLCRMQSPCKPPGHAATGRWLGVVLP